MQPLFSQSNQTHIPGSVLHVSKPAATEILQYLEAAAASVCCRHSWEQTGSLDIVRFCCDGLLIQTGEMIIFRKYTCPTFFQNTCHVYY